MRTSEKRKALNQQLQKKFLDKPTYNHLYNQYRKTKDPDLLRQLNQAYSDFVNYTRLLSLIQTHVKYKSLHIRERVHTHRQELVSEDSLEYLLNQKGAAELEPLATQWETVLESEELVKAISTLPKRQQQILWLLFVEDMPAVQAKEQLNVSQQSISKTKQRALKNVEKLLEEKNE